MIRSKKPRINRLAWLLLLGVPRFAGAQTPLDPAAVLDRLDKLERQNAALTEKVKSLESEVATLRGGQGAAPGTPPTAEAGAGTPETPHVPTPEERLDVVQQRVEEQAQTKVESSQKFPIRITGMALFNSFLNSRGGGGGEYPTAALTTAPEAAGGTLRQSIIGLEFHGPKTLWGGQVQGDVQMDFATSNNTLAESLRIRTGYIGIDWPNTSIMAGLEKPIFNPREPSSLAQVAISPLTGAGNLWLWVPQFRVEQTLAFNSYTGVHAQLGVVETKEASPYSGSVFTGAIAPDRPGVEGRFELYYKLDENRRLEIAPGFHFSTTHAAGSSIPSQVFSADWFFNPWQAIELTGALFNGHNVAGLGAGVVNEGYAIFGRNSMGIAATGGWGQVTVHAGKRTDLHLFVGRQSYWSRVLDDNDVANNFQFGANVFFRIAPNVLLGPEISQMRTSFFSNIIHITNHYDLALAYLF
jgi:hypothetical protein